MSFKSILEELTLKTKATGAIMLDVEGEMVDFYSTEKDHDLDAIGAHKGIILYLMRQVTSKHSTIISGIEDDELSYIGIKTSHGKILIQTLKENYYVVVTMNGAGTLGHAAYEANIAVHKLETEMG